MFVKLNPTLKKALTEIIEVADSNGYFGVRGDASNRRILDELKRLGYVRQISDWTGFNFSTTTFSLESKAYTYNEDEIEYERQLASQSNIIGGFSMFKKLPSNSRALLHEIVESRNPVLMLSERFEKCSYKEDDELRSLLRELVNDRYIHIDWADDKPYCVVINNIARTYDEREAEYERQLSVKAGITHNYINSQINIVSGSGSITANQYNSVDSARLKELIDSVLQKITASFSEDDTVAAHESLKAIEEQMAKKSPNKHQINKILATLSAIKGSVEFAAAVANLAHFILALPIWACAPI